MNQSANASSVHFTFSSFFLDAVGAELRAHVDELRRTSAAREVMMPGRSSQDLLPSAPTFAFPPTHPSSQPTRLITNSHLCNASRSFTRRRQRRRQRGVLRQNHYTHVNRGSGVAAAEVRGATRAPRCKRRRTREYPLP